MLLFRNLLWGVRWGLAFGSVYAVWAGVLFVFRGAAPFQSHEVTVWEAVAVYLVGGVAAGGLMGLLRPLVRWWIGAMLVGMIASVPILLGIAGTATNIAAGETLDWIGVGILAFFLGGGGGIILWRIFHNGDAK